MVFEVLGGGLHLQVCQVACCECHWAKATVPVVTGGVDWWYQFVVADVVNQVFQWYKSKIVLVVLAQVLEEAADPTLFEWRLGFHDRLEERG